MSDHVTTLVNEGLLDASGLSQADKDAVNCLTSDEVDALISIKQKLSSPSAALQSGITIPF